MDKWYNKILNQGLYRKKDLVKESNKQYNYVGNCTEQDAFDGIADIYDDATDFAQHLQKSKQISAQQFFNHVNYTGQLEDTDNECKYFFDHDKNIFILYDKDQDIHYFYSK